MPTLDAIDVWTVVIGVLCNVSCALLGCYLLLRRMSLLGDAISHAVLPGIVVAFIIFQSRASLPIFVGAMALGVLTAFMTQAVHRFANVSQDTSMGVVFTTLFAIGVVLIRVVPGLDKIDLDVRCVFEGNIEYEAASVAYGNWTPIEVLAIVLAVNIAFIVVLWKELKIATFDPALSSSLGFHSGLLFYALMAMVAGTTVSAFWAVGAILVIAMLIVPGATAQLLTDRLASMLLVAAAVGVVSAVVGYALASAWDTSTAGMMATVAGMQYMLALLAAPRHGVLTKWARQLGMSIRIAREDILATIYRWHEARGDDPMPRVELDRDAAARRGGRLALWLLRRAGQVREAAGGLLLSAEGKSVAARLVRSHRLWESYLAEHVGIASDHLHGPAARMEHFVTPEIERELLERLGDSTTDPHGRPIPEE